MDNIERMEALQNTVASVNAEVNKLSSSLGDVADLDGLKKMMEGVDRELKVMKKNSKDAAEGMASIQHALSGVNKEAKTAAALIDSVTAATDDLTEAKEKLAAVADKKSMEAMRLHEEIDLKEKLVAHTKKQIEAERALIRTHKDDAKGQKVFGKQVAQYKLARGNVKEVWQGIKTGDKNKIKAVSEHMNRAGAASGSKNLMKAGSALGEAAGMLARMGPLVGGALAGAVLLAKKATELNTFRTGNIRSYYDIGGANTVANGGGSVGDLPGRMAEEEGTGGFLARQRAYNNFRYNGAIKYGLDAGEAHQVMSGMTSSGMSLEGLLSGASAGSSADRNLAARYSSGAKSYKDVAGETGDGLQIDSMYSKLSTSSRALGMQMEELGLDFGDMTTDFGSSLENLSGFFQTASAGAANAGMMGRDYVKALKQSASYYKSMGGDLPRLTKMMGQISGLTGASMNSLRDMFDSIAKDQGSKSYDEGMQRTGLLMATGGYKDMIDSQIKEQSARVSSKTSNETERAQASANVKKLTWMRDNGALGATAYANNSEFGGKAVAKAQLELLKKINGDNASGALMAGSQGAMAALEGTGMTQDAAKGYSDLLSALNGTASEGKRALTEKDSMGLLDKYDKAQKSGVQADMDKVLAEMTKVTGGKSAAASIRATGSTQSLRAGESTIDDVSRVATGPGELLKELDGAGKLLTNGISESMIGIQKRFDYTKDQIDFLASESDPMRLAAAGINKLVDIASDTLRWMQADSAFGDGDDKDAMELRDNLRSTSAAITEAMSAKDAKGAMEAFARRGVDMPSGITNADGTINKEAASTLVTKLGETVSKGETLRGGEAESFYKNNSVSALARGPIQEAYSAADNANRIANIGSSTMPNLPVYSPVKAIANEGVAQASSSGGKSGMKFEITPVLDSKLLTNTSDEVSAAVRKSTVNTVQALSYTIKERT